MKKLALLTKREKLMLSGLLLAAFAISLYFFVYKPCIDEIAALAEQEHDLAYQVRESVNFADKLSNAISETKKINAQLAIIEQSRFEEIVQEDIILMLNEFFQEADITEKTIAFSGISREVISENFPEHVRQSMEVSISYEAEYAKSIRFFQLIENYERTIYIKNLNLLRGDSNDEPVIGGLVTLVFTAESPYELQESDYEKWNFDNGLGRKNPFTTSTGVFASTSFDETELSDAQNRTPDFFISVKAEASDMPSILIGRSKDETGTSYIYADSNKVENVVLKLMQKEDGYYYSYNTPSACFPENGSMTVFEPVDEAILIRVFSSPRISTSDLSGIQLKIENSTGERIMLVISDDDADRPRVTITGNDTNLEVIRR